MTANSNFRGIDDHDGGGSRVIVSGGQRHQDYLKEVFMSVVWWWLGLNTWMESFMRTPHELSRSIHKSQPLAAFNLVKTSSLLLIIDAVAYRTRSSSIDGSNLAATLSTWEQTEQTEAEKGRRVRTFLAPGISGCDRMSRNALFNLLIYFDATLSCIQRAHDSILMVFSKSYSPGHASRQTRAKLPEFDQKTPADQDEHIPAQSKNFQGD